MSKAKFAILMGVILVVAGVIAFEIARANRAPTSLLDGYTGDELLEMILTQQEQAMGRIKSYEVTAESTARITAWDGTVYSPSTTINGIGDGRNRWFSRDMRQQIVTKDLPLAERLFNPTDIAIQGDFLSLRQHNVTKGVSNSSYVAIQYHPGSVRIYERGDDGQTARHPEFFFSGHVGYLPLLTGYGFMEQGTLRRFVEESLDQDWISWSAEAAISEEGSEVFLLKRMTRMNPHSDFQVRLAITVDPSKGFAAVKTEHWGRNGDGVIDVELAEVKPGVWFPMRITTRATNSSGVEVRNSTYEVVNYRINEPVDEKWFDWRNLGTPSLITRVAPEGDKQIFALIDGREVLFSSLDPAQEEERNRKLLDRMLEAEETDAFPENSDGQPSPVIDGAAAGGDETMQDSKGTSSRIFIAVCLLSLSTIGIIAGALWKFK